MLAAASLSSPASSSWSSSSSSSSSSHLFQTKSLRRSISLPPLRPVRTAQAPRVCASCASAAEHAERERTADSYYYSRGCRGGGVLKPTLYDVLGITAVATTQEIKAAYRRLARACHPDVVAAGPKGASADEFMRVHAAYATLSDPGKRAEYDRRVVVASAAAATRQRATPGFSWHPPGAAASYYSPPSPASPNPSSPSSSFGRRTWETDQCW